MSMVQVPCGLCQVPSYPYTSEVEEVSQIPRGSMINLPEGAVMPFAVQSDWIDVDCRAMGLSHGK